jgi:hypothetical protein
MGGTVEDLKTTFANACAIFNKNLDPTIGGLLTPSVIVYSVSEHDVYEGISNVEGFFKQDYADKPHFDPYTNYTPQYVVTPDGQTGFISGEANWTDNNGPEILRYWFEFIYSPTAPNNWLISNLNSLTI